jgi:uncharacterized protein
MQREIISQKWCEPVTVIVKPLVDCNLRCVYCYEAKSPYQGMRMDYDTLRNVIIKFARYNGPNVNTQFIWHGGEPLLMGLRFFQRIVEIQQELGADYSFTNGVQTNGTLISEEFLDFFAEHNFQIGVSLDGPQYLHDLQRPYFDGRGSFNSVMTALNLLMHRHGSNGKPICSGVLAVLTRNTVTNIDGFYNFFRSNGFNVKINPIIYIGRGEDVREILGLTPTQYREAMIHLFDLWINDDRDFTIDLFEEILGNLVTWRPQSCQFRDKCHRTFLAVAPNGDVYPCGRMHLRPFRLGNINENSVEEMLRAPLLDQIDTERTEIKACRDCQYGAICNSGCLQQSIMRRGRLSDCDYYCPGYKALFIRAHEVVSQELGTVPIAMLNKIDLATIQNIHLRKAVENRLLLNSQGPEFWMDKTWMQWRGDHSVYYQYKKYSDYGDWGNR